ncbi:MAG: asparagine synthase-related protein [Clostridia bacterium]|nr:asparagine synthase-related protein [Clostridia bacterium]
MSAIEKGLPVTRLGRHELCAHCLASDGGAMAYGFGEARNLSRLEGEFKRAGVYHDRRGGASALVLAAYRLWGENFPRMIEGLVTAAVIDLDASRLILVRDRMGAYPIYYARRASCVVFSDDFKRVLDSPFVTREIDKSGLCELFALGPSGTPGLTPIKDVLALKPGCALIADYFGLKEKEYFNIYSAPSSDDENTAAEKIRFLVEDALIRTLPENPAVMLSGGLDSSILAYIMKKRGNEVRAWSVEYEHNDVYYRPNDYQHDPDGSYVKFACADLNAQKHIVRIGPEQLANAIVEAGAARGFPGMGDVDSSLMLFARDIANEEKSILSGECADEVFGGYPWFHDERLLSMDGFPWSGSMELRESVLNKKVLDLLNIRQYEAARYHEAVAAKRRLRDVSERENRLRLTHALCFEWFMPVLQLRADKMCSGEGLKVLTPFCDDRLAQYAYSLPWEIKNLGGQPKGILRKAFADLLPEKILNRRKSPYPKTHHPMYAKAICEMMAAVLNDASEPVNEICDAESIRKIMSCPLEANDKPWFGQLMTGAQLIAYLLQVNSFLKDNNIAVAL